MRISGQKPVVYLAWTLTLAYSFAPFDLAIGHEQQDSRFSLGEPREWWEFGILAVHLLAFAATGATDRLGSPRSTLGHPFVTSVLVRGLLFCVIVELGQMFVFSRHAELTDLIVNAAGLSLGHRFAPVLLRRWPGEFPGAAWLSGRWRPILVAAWTLFWSAALLAPAHLVTLHGWAAHYPLLIGVEQYQTRPWSGQIRYLAFYDRSLHSDQIKTALEDPRGAPLATPARQNLGLLDSYDFTREARFQAAPGAGLNASIASSGAFSVEVWCQPADPSEGGEATILGLSETIWRRNFMLGQDGGNLVFRVRNHLSGPNGSRFELRSPRAISGDQVQIVATYDHGISSIFSNGERLNSTVNLREPSVALGLGVGQVGHAVTAILCSLSLILLTVPTGTRRFGVVGLLLLGYSCLLPAAILGALFSSSPTMGLYVWFGPTLVVTWILLSDG